MNTEEICRIGGSVIRRCSTRDPFKIAALLGVHVLYCSGFGSLKGMYRVIKRNRFIFLNDSLDERMRKIVCAHELGHDQLHRKMAQKNALREFSLFEKSSIPEYEANLFASEILLDTQTVLDAIFRDAYTSQQIAELTGTDVNLVALKVGQLAAQGLDLRLQEHRSDFLKTRTTTV